MRHDGDTRPSIERERGESPIDLDASPFAPSDGRLIRNWSGHKQQPPMPDAPIVPPSETPRTPEGVLAARWAALSRNLTALMDSRRMSFQDMADVAGVSRSAIWNIVDGKKEPRISTLWPICDFFGVTLSELFQASGSPRTATPEPTIDDKRLDHYGRFVRDVRGHLDDDEIEEFHQLRAALHRSLDQMTQRLLEITDD